MSLSQYAHPEVLVDTQWVVDHLNDPNVRLIDAGVSSEMYNTGHIPVQSSGTDSLTCYYPIGGQILIQTL